MPNIKSAKKRMVLSERAREKNRAERSRLRTALKRAREATDAKDAEDRYRALFGQMDQGLGIAEIEFEGDVPVDFRWIDVNRQFEEVTGLPRAELSRRIDEGLRALERCRVCPRDCDVNRLENETAICHAGRRARVSSYFAHFGEEDCLRGWNGSGTIFFGWCNLRCVFCQNWETSQEGAGEEVGPHELAAMMLELQARGCHNINWVTPEHVVPQILESLPYALEGGLKWHRRRRERQAAPIPPGSTPVGGAGVTQEAAASAVQPPMDATNEG